MTSIIKRPVRNAPVFIARSGAALFIRAGATIAGASFEHETPIDLPELTAGNDYSIIVEGGALVIREHAPNDGAIGGFHFAPGGNATARAGGDQTPAINPLSIWDEGYRPKCADPRSMALISDGIKSFWCDIYMLGVNHIAKGSSRFGETIADGDDCPEKPGGGHFSRFDFESAKAALAHHGKRLPTYDEFRLAAFGVSEKSSTRKDPETTGLDAARTGRFGIMQATGNLWVWGTDGDPDEPRPSIFGGSWILGGFAGSRYAYLDYWPDDSSGNLSARGCCDHLSLE